MIRIVIQFLILFFLQVLVINNLELSFYINPYIFPLFILSLPLKTSRPALLFIAFGSGLLMDFFCNSGGMHAAALTWLAYMRPYIYQSLSPRSNIDMDEILHVKAMGLSSFFYYSIILLFLHHFLFFFLEAFSFSNFFLTLFKVILSTAVTTILIVILAIFFAPQKSRN